MNIHIYIFIYIYMNIYIINIISRSAEVHGALAHRRSATSAHLKARVAPMLKNPYIKSYRVPGLGFRIWGQALGLGFRLQTLRFRIQALGFRV